MDAITKLPFFLLIPLLFSPSLARAIPPRSTTSLDVAASLQKTTQLFAQKPDPLSDQKFTAQKPDPLSDQMFTTAAVSNLSLHIHPRASLLPQLSSSDYKALTLERLRRDQARVDAIAARLQVALDGINRSDLTPLVRGGEDETFDQEAIEAPITSGSSQGSGEYFTRLDIGSPPKPLYMVLDTGSDVTWVQCEPCTDCYQQSDPIFDPSASSSYSPVSCDSSSCRSLDISACRNDTCLYQVSYGDGSYTVGDFATETVSFGSSNSVSDVAVGCGHDNEGLFVASAGILGLGGGALSFPSQIQARSFSYCLVDRDSTGSSTLDFGSDVSASAVTAPLLKNQKMDTFYYVTMTGISVGGQMLSIPPSTFQMDVSGSGGIIVDSGTAITRLQTAAYGQLRDAFVKGTGDLARAEGVALFDTCYDLGGRTSVEVPTVAFHFGGEAAELRLPAKNYLIPVDSAGTFCLAFAPTSSPLSIIGNVQQQGTRVAFDLEDSTVGFTANKC